MFPIFPEFIGNSTVFLVKNDRPMATGFIVAIRDNENGTSRRLYLVTARHNIERAGFDTTISIRHNTKTAKFVECDYNTTAFHMHPMTDIAVAPLMLRGVQPNDVDTQFIDDLLMVRRDEFANANIRPGSEVCLVSLFHHHVGEARMQPIWRFGKVAMIPDDDVLLKVGTTKQKVAAVLIETMVWPGASGAPVYVIRSGPAVKSEDQVPLKLLGLISSHFEVLTQDRTDKSIDKLGEKIAREASTTKKENISDAENTDKATGETETTSEEEPEPQIDSVHLNTGISAVIPAYLIREFVIEVHIEMGGWMPTDQ